MDLVEQFSTDSFRLDGKVAIVTGGASGLGQYYTQALIKSGAKVMIASIRDRGVAELQAFAQKNGSEVGFISRDVTLKNAAKDIVDATVQKFGRLDILINNAGVQIRNKWDEFEDEDWQKVIDTNLTAAYHLAHEAALVMAKAGGGKIINIGSMQSYRAGKFIFPYTASKHGVMGLTKAYADALAPKNIQVNALAPGYIDTPMTKSLQEDHERNSEILNHIPAGHWADPSELMGAIVFLASPAANYITGVTLPVDGGYLLR